MVTLPKHEAKYNLKGSIWLIAVLGLFFFSACSHRDCDETVDKLNTLSYAFHYKNLDSVNVYSNKALRLATDYPAGRAEAYNNLAFVNIAKMEYEKAYRLLDSVELITDNQVELLIADVQLMRLCQRESKNKDFYDYRERAIGRIRRIYEERNSLSDRVDARFLYARTEFAIVSSTYYYYVGLTNQAAEALAALKSANDIQNDTAQYLNLLYQIGSGGIIAGKSKHDIYQDEFEYLVKCYSLAQQAGMVYWEANALQAISEHLLDKDEGRQLIANNKPVIRYLNVDNMPNSLLAGYFAQKSLDLFNSYGDIYQVAGAYRTLSSCYWALGDYRSSLICLENALTKNVNIEKSPSQVASIRECLSLVYSAMNDKYNSDINRNKYLDIQDETRQDRQLEARVEQLQRISSQQNILIISILCLIVVVVALLFFFNKLGKRMNNSERIKSLLIPLQKYEDWKERKSIELDEKYEAASETLSLSRLKLEKNKKNCLDNRAKVFLVNGVLPFIDRIANEVKRLKNATGDEEECRERFAYIAELTDCINSYNNVLTHWIQIQQGKLSINIESFNLRDLFSLLAKSEMSFRLKGVELSVVPLDVVVKADKVLTLFMLNTIADNARKFTPKGGAVKIYAVKEPTYVEISVEDNGVGLSQAELSSIFDHTVYNGHGFGLMNCKGIINKYRKISKTFNVCGLYAESEKGHGSRFFFRLPYGLVRSVLLILFFCYGVVNLKASNITAQYAAEADAYADSAYYSNVNGNYEKTLTFADSVFKYLNKLYKAEKPNDSRFITLEGENGKPPAEIQWFHEKININYDIILDIRNESAVAALALHEWDLYTYNNKAYTQLFKEVSADKGLDDYCMTIQNSSMNKAVAVVLLVLLLVTIVFAYYFLYYRHVLFFRLCVDKVENINKVLLSDISDVEKLARVSSVDTNRFPNVLKTILLEIKSSLSRSVNQEMTKTLNLELIEDEHNRVTYEAEKFYITNNVIDNGLSALKHETMYYPSRIRQLIDGAEKDIDKVSEVVEYYKELYSILCRQVNEQLRLVSFECKTVSIKSLTGIDGYVLGDATLIAYLFETLKKRCGFAASDISLSTKSREYAKFHIVCRDLCLTDEEYKNLFTVPSTENIPFFVCRQIVRECAEQTNLHGCGITVTKIEEGGALIELVLPRSLSDINAN